MKKLNFWILLLSLLVVKNYGAAAGGWMSCSRLGPNGRVQFYRVNVGALLADIKQSIRRQIGVPEDQQIVKGEPLNMEHVRAAKKEYDEDHVRWGAGEIGINANLID